MGEFILKIGTRGSDLALFQANTLKDLLNSQAELKIIKTAGDRLLNIDLQGALEKGFFTSELEECLQSGEIDAAVHSLKDLPTELPKDLKIGAHLKRGPVPDILIVHKSFHDPKRELPVREGCVIGTSSLRRKALLKRFSPGSNSEMLRGNVPTRIRKLSEEKYGAIILAKAGVERLALDTSSFIVYELNPKLWLPAPGQGVIAVEIRVGDYNVENLLKRIDDKWTARAAFIERTLMSRFEGGCHSPFGAFARHDDSQWTVTLGLEGKKEKWLYKKITGSDEDCISFGPDRMSEMSEQFNTENEVLCAEVSGL